MSPSYSDSRQFILDLKQPWRKALRYAAHWWDGPFARDTLLGAMLWEYDPSRLGSTSFINYAAWVNYYPEEATTTEFLAGDARRSVRMPYNVLVDLTTERRPRMPVHQPLGTYTMPEAMTRLTQPNLDAYLAEKKWSFNGSIVRLERFAKSENGDCAAAISLARYWDQCRTNLSIDRSVSSEGDRRPLRERDLGPGASLRPFHESILVN